MAWNEPGNNGQREPQRDPWNKNNRPPAGKPNLDALLKNLQKRFSKLGGSSGGMLTIVAALIIAGLLLTSYTIVAPTETGVVLRLGEYSRTLGPGFHFKLPQPIETVTKLQGSQVRAVADQAHMLTSDENIVAVDYTVQYQVADARKYLFAARDPEGTLRQAAQSAVRSVLGAQKMDAILNGAGAGAGPLTTTLQNQARDLLQHTLDAYDCGIKIADISFQDVIPPQEAKAAFDAVNTAREDKQTLIDQATAAASQEIPQTSTDISRTEADAEAYRAARITRAQGDVTRFNLILKEYNAAPDVTRRRMWLETVEQVMANNTKVIDGSDGRSVINVQSERADNQAVPVKDMPGVGTVAQPGAAPPTESTDKEKQP
jgi:membrane protease subunit HflK